MTDQILGMYTTGNNGFLIRDTAENGVGDEQTLTSRHQVADNPPQLVLAFDDSTPETLIDSGPVSPTDSTEASFTFSSDRSDAAFECSLDGSAFQRCSPPHTVGGLAEGDHSLRVRATRRIRAVDPTPASYDWTVAIPPETAIDTGPASPSASADATLSFSADDPEATFECSLNGAPFAGCTSPVEYTNLADGDNEVRVRATDPLGNTDPSPAVHAWTVAVTPETTIDSGPPALGNSTSATFEFSGTDNGPEPSPLAFECRVDSGDWAACSSPQEYVDLADGEHTFEVQATDQAGNREPEPASRTWKVDTVAPTTTIDAGPPQLGQQHGGDLRVRRGRGGRASSAGWTEATGPPASSPQEYTDLADGSHTFDVRATDPAGNLGPEAALRRGRWTRWRR